MDEGLVLKNRLKEARADRGLSQAELAKLVGVSRNTISSIDRAVQPHGKAGPGAVHRPGQEVRGPLLLLSAAGAAYRYSRTSTGASSAKVEGVTRQS